MQSHNIVFLIGSIDCPGLFSIFVWPVIVGGSARGQCSFEIPILRASFSKKGKLVINSDLKRQTLP